MFKKSFSFNGRIRRLEYGLSYLFYIVLLVVFSLLTKTDSEKPSLVFFLIDIPLIWFLLAQGAKRCHDRGNSGWWQLIPFYVFWMVFADGKQGENGYGLNPKGIGNVDEIDEIGSDMSS